MLAERGNEISDGLMELPHTQPLDVIAAEEISSLAAQLEAIDGDLERRGGPFWALSGTTPSRSRALEEVAAREMR